MWPGKGTHLGIGANAQWIEANADINSSKWQTLSQSRSWVADEGTSCVTRSVPAWDYPGSAVQQSLKATNSFCDYDKAAS